jgi:hypothetical protein
MSPDGTRALFLTVSYNSERSAVFVTHSGDKTSLYQYTSTIQSVIFFFDRPKKMVGSGILLCQVG